ncbi:hypothetical protein GF402_00395 [Candidatus Fermentibacteria bacterium]|nr:hypothetical protein [Candidatus Fermentibacteria bacterium]
MSERALEAIKGAILLERRGSTFYRSVADKTDNGAVAEVFRTMAAEEKKHESVLNEHYSSLVRDGRLAAISDVGGATEHDEEIINRHVKGEIEASGYEAAAISAAMGLEKEAISYYDQKASEGEGDTERELYEWLSRWEQTHLEFLARMDRALMEQVWFDNRFWPEI